MSVRAVVRAWVDCSTDRYQGDDLETWLEAVRGLPRPVVWCYIYSSYFLNVWSSVRSLGGGSTGGMRYILFNPVPRADHVLMSRIWFHSAMCEWDKVQQLEK